MIETARLILATPTIGDLNDFYEYGRESDTGPLAGWVPHTSLAESEEILKSIIFTNDTLGIYLKESMKLIGTISLHKREIDFVMELGYTLSSKYWGKGYMTEAGQAVIEIGFSKLKLQQINANYFPFNLRSKRVLDKLGFVYEEMIKSDKYLPFSETIIRTKLTKIYYEEMKK